MSQDQDAMTLFPESPSLRTNREIRFFVIGTPRPGGSKRAIPLKNLKIAVVEDGRHTKTWREDVQAAARKAYSGPLLLGPLLVTMIFVFRRPKSHHGTGRNHLRVKPSAPRDHVQKPDVLKLARSVEDALTGVIWGDDRQTVRLKIMKRWCDACEAGGCLVMVTPITRPRRGQDIIRADREMGCETSTLLKARDDHVTCFRCGDAIDSADAWPGQMDGQWQCTSCWEQEAGDQWWEMWKEQLGWAWPRT